MVLIQKYTLKNQYVKLITQQSTAYIPDFNERKGNIIAKRFCYPWDLTQLKTAYKALQRHEHKNN